LSLPPLQPALPATDFSSTKLQQASPSPVKMETPAPHPQEESAMVVVLPSLISTTIIAATSPTFVPNQSLISPSTRKLLHANGPMLLECTLVCNPTRKLPTELQEKIKEVEGSMHVSMQTRHFALVIFLLRRKRKLICYFLVQGNACCGVHILQESSHSPG
jgi:hypothetical protein